MAIGIGGNDKHDKLINSDKKSNDFDKLLAQKKFDSELLMKKEIDELYKKNKIINDKLEKLNSQILLKQNDIDYLIKEYDRVINSKSWKITRPFRKILEVKNEIIEKLNTTIDYKQSILVLVHSWQNIYDKNDTKIGGTTLNVIDIINSLRNKINFYVLTVINEKYMLVVFKDGYQEIYDLNVEVKVRRFDAYDFDFYYLFNNLIKSLKIDLIHFHHILNFPCDIDTICPNVKKVFSFHDFSCICARCFLLDYEEKYCEDINEDRCLMCTKNKCNINVRNVAIKNFINNIDKFIVPDLSVAKKINEYLELKDYDVIPHGIDYSQFEPFVENKKNNTKIKNIAFVGYIDSHKGSKYLKELVENNHGNIIYHLFGTTNINIDANDKFINHGNYKKNDLPKLLNDNKIDLVLLLSTCFETFSYTLSEVIYAKIPCLAFNIGAIASRIIKDEIGWVIDKNSTFKDIVKQYDKIFDKNEYDKKLKNIEKYVMPTKKEMIEKVKKIYTKMYENKTMKDYYIINKELKKYYLKYWL